MAFDMNTMSSLFAAQPPPPPQQQPQQQQQQQAGVPAVPPPQNLWALQQQFGAAGQIGVGNLGGMLSQFPAHNMANQLILGGGGGVPQQQQQAQQQMSQAPIAEPPKADTIQGIGVLTWLSAKAGLITCKDKMVISFQLKDFCDQMLNDLTSVLRVGFTLSFQAALNETSEYTATLVQPIYGAEADLVFHNSPEVDLEPTNSAAPNSKDAYSVSIEARAIPALLAIFQRHGLQQIQLSSLHSQMSNCGDDELFRYVGTSSLKRRQFVERRTHIFRLQNDDSIILQYPSVYVAVYKCASFLLRRGGATAIQSLFDFYVSNEIAPEIREHVGETRQEFLQLITAHSWVFALFPNRTYVSVRRNLPRYDYPEFIKQHFPELDISRQMRMGVAGYGQPPRGIQRTMSVQMPPQFNTNVPTNGAQRQQSMLLQQQASSRPISLWDSQNSLSHPADQWSPLFSPTTWSNQARVMPPLMGAAPNDNFLLGGGAAAANINTLLSMGHLNPRTVSRGIQSDLSPVIGGNPIGRGGCTCQCQCGRGGAGVIGNRGSSSRASGGSATPPSVDSNSPYERYSPLNGIGSIGDRLSAPSTTGATNNSDLSVASSSGPATASSTNSQRYYDPFGTADLLNGSRLSSLRI
ncbi:unnamed protein product [Caenorhabditis bovis]|uniref:Lin-66-like winged helix domain-containing protein n=1 Tax=Caenorhabditis bovis TaxID=2654633 RepID=A0A8S1F1X4_9PELO|nr:unnamed protein product [Caenorhabditis bovis]